MGTVSRRQECARGVPGSVPVRQCGAMVSKLHVNRCVTPHAMRAQGDVNCQDSSDVVRPVRATACERSDGLRSTPDALAHALPRPHIQCTCATSPCHGADA
ncbi:hypothetical protein HAX54_020566, partial [Datura stramonium]|nr:hypothetical protein [Datura stramonium]